MECPRRPQATCLVGMRCGQILQSLQGRRIDGSCRRSFLQKATGMADIPIVGGEHQFCQFRIAEFGERRLRLIGHRTDHIFSILADGIIRDLVDATVAAIVLLNLSSMAGLHVVPVNHPGIAIRTIPQVENLRCAVAGQQKVGAMTSDVSRSLRSEEIHVQSLAMNIVHEELVAITRRPGIGEVDHGTGMGVAAARLVGLVVASMRGGAR